VSWRLTSCLWSANISTFVARQTIPRRILDAVAKGQISAGLGDPYMRL
jgi:hypothetical protein